MITAFYQHLAAAGVSRTKSRTIMYEYLAERGPVSMPQLQAGLENRLDRASIYRNLELFRSLGVVHEVGMGRDRRFELSDAYSPHHHHFTCANCGLMATLELASVEQQLVRLAELRGYVLHGHQIELSGLCAVCAAAY